MVSRRNRGNYVVDKLVSAWIMEIAVEYGLKHSDIGVDIEELYVAGAFGYVSYLNSNSDSDENGIKGMIRLEIEKFIEFYRSESNKIQIQNQNQNQKECCMVVESRLTDIPRKGKKPKTVEIHACSNCGYNLGDLPCDIKFCCGCGYKITNAL